MFDTLLQTIKKDEGTWRLRPHIEAPHGVSCFMTAAKSNNIDLTPAVSRGVLNRVIQHGTGFPRGRQLGSVRNDVRETSTTKAYLSADYADFTEK